MSKIWAIIGGGNGGQTMAGHLGIMGEKVRLYDVIPETVDAINAKGGINLHHAINGFGKLEFATTDIAKVMDGADIIMMILPSIYHADMAKKIIPHLSDGMIVFLHPEASCGAIAFRKTMADMGCKADVVVAAASTLLYSTRIQFPGDVYVYGIKNEVPIAALPACDNDKLEAAIRPELPWFKIVLNVLHTSLDNMNALMHPAPMLLNTSRIEAEPFVPYEYYHEGITPSIGKYVESMDKERAAIALAFGFRQRTLMQEYIDMYSCGGPNTPLYQLCRNNPSYKGVMAANTLSTRYILEDIPYSLEAIRALAQVANVPTPCIDAIITVGRTIIGDKMDEGRTAKALGIESMGRDELLQYVMK